ncbi:MAG: HAD-IA family hydrolase [Spirochaetaceae bacterium]|nr:HAD-IA family hydrolase [Spirochaetaceae bacterium]
MLRYLLLDLDNTLYSEATGLERAVFRRMNEYVAEYLGIGSEEVAALRSERMRHYGTTLEWLIAERGFDAVEDYYARVHPAGEEEPLSADPALGRLLDSIPLPKSVFTNAPMEHAERILARLGVADRFEAVYDIRYNKLKGKPHADAVRRVCAACGVEPAEALFVDDYPKYVQGFIDCGGRGLLIDELDRFGDSGLPRIHSLAELPGLVAAEAVAASQLCLF